jgi:hypothetical protein
MDDELMNIQIKNDFIKSYKPKMIEPEEGKRIYFVDDVKANSLEDLILKMKNGLV